MPPHLISAIIQGLQGLIQQQVPTHQHPRANQGKMTPTSGGLPCTRMESRTGLFLEINQNPVFCPCWTANWSRNCGMCPGTCEHTAIPRSIKHRQQAAIPGIRYQHQNTGSLWNGCATSTIWCNALASNPNGTGVGLQAPGMAWFSQCCPSQKALSSQP